MADANTIDYTQKNIPPWALLMRQQDVMPPDAVQLAQSQTPDGVPAFLTPDPKSAPGMIAGTPNPANNQLPPAPPPTLASNPQSLKQLPVVPPYQQGAGTGHSSGLGAYVNPNRGMDQALLQTYNQAAQESLAGQKAGVDQIQQYINQVAGSPSDINWTPLAAYVDSLKPGSNLTAAAKAMAPMTPEQKQQMLMNLQFKLQGAKQSMSQENLNELGTQLRAQQQQNQMNMMMQHYANEDKANAQRADSYGIRAGIAQDNLADKAVQHITTDKQLNNYIPRIQGANRILSQLQDVRAGRMIDTNQFLNDINNEYVNLLTGANNSALGKLERTEYSTYAGKLSNVIQQVAAHPESINSPDILQQIETGVTGLRDTYRQNYDQRADSLRRNYAHTPQANIEQQKAIESGKSAYGMGASGMAPAKIQVSNGKESLLIDPADLEHAQKDGYSQVKQAGD